MQPSVLPIKEITINDAVENDASLSVFQKILLITDGTVTDLLSLYTQKTIQVKKLMQEIVYSGEQQLNFCSLNTPLLKRCVLICSNTENYIYAESTFVFEHLSRSAQYHLLETDQPIGLIWKAEKLESYRDVIGYSIEANEKVSKLFRLCPESKFVSRTYLIYHRQVILGEITEKFPLTYFRKHV